MKKYMAIFRIRFINALQYRAAALAGMTTQFAWGFMLILAYAAFYRSNPAAFPMEFSQMVSYIWIQQAFFTLYTAWIQPDDITAAIETGAIAYEMVRPVDLYSRWFFQITATRVARAALRCLPVLLVAFIVPAPFRMTLPPDLPSLLLFFLSTFLSLCVVAVYTLLVYTTIFYTLSVRGVRTFLGALCDFFDGAIIPLPFFPKPMQAVMELLPFASMQNAPLRIFSGNLTGMGAARAILLQAFWFMVLLLAGRLYISRTLKKIIVQGG
ncbi:MAG: ABC transporter permease [Peptococcaceae bacterium]|jgi:ABC-2 type transport system permease protein|nr:ABC transporter permease [Peptococcaceae bacterium]